MQNNALSIEGQIADALYGKHVNILTLRRLQNGVGKFPFILGLLRLEMTTE